MNKIVGKEKKLIMIFLVLSFIASTIEISFAPIIQSFIDALTNRELNMVGLSVLLFFLFIFFNFLFHYLATIIEFKLLKRIHLISKNQIMTNFLRLNLSIFRETTIGEKINVFDYNLEIYEQYYLENIFLVIQNLFVVSISFAYLLYLSPMISLVLFVCALLSFIIPSIASKKIDSLTEKNSKLKSKYLDVLKEIFGGFEVIKSFKVEKNFNAKHLKALTNLEQNNQQLKIQNNQFNIVIGSTQYLILIVCFCVSGYLVIQGKLSLGEMIAISQITNMVIQPLQLLGGAIVEIAGSKTIRNDLEQYVGTQQNHNKAKKIISNEFNVLELEDVSYPVNGAYKVLKNINLLFEKGKKYAIVGYSGSGKTTLLNIIAQLIDDYTGNILYNGQKINVGQEINYNTVFVHQDTFIFNENLKNNITLLQNYADSVVERAILFSELEEKNNCMGETIVNEKGVNLSGGERQRVAIARAVIRDAPIILMDEITSALDYKTGRQIIEKLLLNKEKTMIFVTHDLRKSFLNTMDQIICLKNGIIVEQGGYTELYQKQGFFYRLSNAS
ncbi:ABC transporter ATP-binding protein [Vagococcus entomophilus]|uniref:ABC transporter ATP-binding protein n=1 Tax=Vagococcus entomophilus TaxID=1160095 RepID=A0A430AHC2_9ENTE|nr:ABC transporter ATP-binding protein [Vagococcus entomophilus]RSU07310.1 hypothetical protein CBF30_08650 [Vagococcus entomophilus]